MPAAKKFPEIARTTDGRPYAQEGFITQLFRQPENELTVSVVNFCVVRIGEHAVATSSTAKAVPLFLAGTATLLGRAHFP